jgi:predicted AAA+ superfamily ATPase
MIVKRDLYLNKLISLKDKDLIKVVTGMRRSGKTVLLFELFYGHLLESGVDESHIIRINLEYVSNMPLRNITALYAEIKARIKDEKRYYVLLDEIQYVDSFEDLLNSLKSEFHCDVYVTGSNSKLLSKDISTKLRGRSIEVRVFPFSFKEYMEVSKKDKAAAFNEYMYYGGLPFMATETDDLLKKEYLKMMCDTVITKDIIDRYKIRNPELFNAVFDFLCSNIGSYVNSLKISNTLASNGIKITDDTVSRYIDYMQDAFLFYKVARFDVRGKEYLKSLYKYYITDIGIRNQKINYRQIEVTHTLENIIYNELLVRGYTVDIGKNQNKEIDFIARRDGSLSYIQVAYSVADADKMEQEISSFYTIADGYEKILITMDTDPFTQLKNGYKKISVYDFLLEEGGTR